MRDFAASTTRLIDELKRLPGIGQKTAQRLAFYLLRVDCGLLASARFVVSGRVSGCRVS